MVATGWRIDPDTLSLTNLDVPDRHSVIYSAQEFAAQQWPPCPVCGTTVDVNQIDVTLNEEDERRNGRTYISGPWSCPRGCNPVTGQRLHYAQQFGGGADGGRSFRCSCGTEEYGLSADEFTRLREEHPVGKHA